MLQIRRSEDRGRVELDWLDTKHSFSFGSYHDPEQMGFRALRVINEDRIAPASGFDNHSHQDMEILTYVLEGALEHRDSLGSGSVIRPGDIQRMSAGTGVQHSERNPSDKDEVKLLQIWIMPEHRGAVPSYEERHFEAEERTGKLRLVASQNGREGSVRIDADVSLYAGLFALGNRADLAIGADRYVWVQVISGTVDVEVVGGITRLNKGDGAAISDESHVGFETIQESGILVFDLA